MKNKKKNQKKDLILAFLIFMMGIVIIEAIIPAKSELWASNNTTIFINDTYLKQAFNISNQIIYILNHTLYYNHSEVCTAANGLCNQTFTENGTGNITGSGTTNYIPYWTSESNLGTTGMKYVNNKLYLGTELPYGGYLNINSIAQGNNYYQNGTGIRLSHYSGNYQDTAGLYFLTLDTHTSGSPATYGIIFDTQAAHSGTASGGSITGMYMLTRQASDKQLYYMYALYPYLYIQGTGAVSAAYNIYLPLYVAPSCQLTYYYGLFIPTPNVQGTLYHNYGIYLKNQSKGLLSNYAIYTEGGNLFFALNSNEKFVVRGQPSQTANIQEWQNGTTTIAYISPNGTIQSNTLSGSGNAYVCVDSNGRLYRSNIACV